MFQVCQLGYAVNLVPMRLCQGTQRENEKLMNQLHRAHDRTRMLENELRK